MRSRAVRKLASLISWRSVVQIHSLATLLLRSKFIKKEGFIILKIRRIEANKLRECGYGWAVKKSYSRHPSYYVVEELSVLNFLNEFNKSIKVK